MSSTASADGRAAFSLRRSHQIDFSSATPQGVSRLPCGLHARCVAFHPSRSVVAVALDRSLAEFDVLSGAKLGCAHFLGTPVSMRYMPDGSAVVLLMQNGSIMAWSTTNWRSRTINPPMEKLSERGMDEGFLAIGHNVLFFAQRMHTTVRGVTWTGKANKKKSVKLKLDNHKKPIVGLECSPTGKELYVAYADQSIRAYNIATQAPVFSPISMAGPKESRSAMASGSISIAPHPFIATAHLLMAAYSNGRVGVWEIVPGRPPARLGQVELPDVDDILGLGLHAPGSAVTVFTYSTRTSGYSAYAWQILYDPRSRSVSLLGANMEPRDITAIAAGVPPTIVSQPTTRALYESNWWQTPSWTTQRTTGPGEPAIRSVVLSPYDGSFAVHLWPSAAKLPPKLIGDLTAEEAVPARSLLTVPILQAVTVTAPCHATPVHRVSPMHSPIGFWSDTAPGKPLLFTRPLHVIACNKLQVHRQSDGACIDTVSLPAADEEGHSLEARLMTESHAQQALLIFFAGTEPPRPDKVSAKVVWRFTCVLEKGQDNWWFLPGMAGAFFGFQDDHFAILEQSSQSVAVYRTQEMSDTRPPLYRIALECPGGVFQGPPKPAASLDSTVESSTGEADFLETSDAAAADLPEAGAILWVGPGGRLCVLSAPAEAGAAAEGGAEPLLQHPCPSASLQLRSSAERVLQVAWQPLSDDTAFGAVLTSMRLLVVSKDLELLMEFEAGSACQGAVLPIINCLWVGPALLFMTAAGQVMMLGWDGAPHLVCGVADTAPAPVLAAALGDRLLLLRDAGQGTPPDLCARILNLFQPLAIAWATLATRGVLPGGVAQMRRALRSLASNYDGSAAGRSLLAVLAVSGAGDLAGALADNAVAPPGSAVSLACCAAAGDWSRAADILMDDFRRSVHYPRPPPEGTALRAKMLSLARGASSQGQFGAAKRMYEAAGDVTGVLILEFLAGDFEALKRHISQAGSGGEDSAVASWGSPSQELLAQFSSALVAANEASFQQGSSAGMMQWELEQLHPEGGDHGDAWDLAPPGSVPSMRSAEGLATSGMIPSMNPDNLVPYLGVPTSANLPAGRRSGGEDFGREADSPSSSVPATPRDGGDAQEAARMAFQMGDDHGFDSSDDDDKSMAGSEAGSEASGAVVADAGRNRLQIRIRAAPTAAQQQPDVGALKAAAMTLSLAPPGAKKGFAFKKSRTESSFGGNDSDDSSEFSSQPSSPRTRTTASPEKTAASASGFSSAASSVPASPAASSFSLGRPSPSSSLHQQQQQQQHSQLPPLPPISPKAAASAAAGGGGSNQPHQQQTSLAAFRTGATQMEAGNWPAAISAFSTAMDSLDQEARASGLDPGKKQQRQALMAHYLAAVQLLQFSREAVSGPGADGAGQVLRAKMLRFAAALGLQPEHLQALKQDSVRRNMEVGNYGYATGVLEGIVAAALEKGNNSLEYMTHLQETLGECDSKGARDASVPSDEDPSVFAEIVGTASGSEDVMQLVRQIYEE